MHVQVPPNLSYDDFPRLLESGIDDWGGVSPVTIDHVNPEAPWPEIERLREATEAARLRARAAAPDLPGVRGRPRPLGRPTDRAGDPASTRTPYGLAREDRWAAGARERRRRHRCAGVRAVAEPLSQLAAATSSTRTPSPRSSRRAAPTSARCSPPPTSCAARSNGDEVTYVVTRNINYTNVCYFRCGFCAFSKGKLAENLRGAPYLVPLDEVVRRCREAWERGAVEVCLQGGIHPAFTGDYYVEICEAVKEELPDLHVHAFSALEVWQGAATLGLPLADYLARLRDVGLASLPGTAAEILDDEVRRDALPGQGHDRASGSRCTTTAHRAGLRSTTTIMFGSVEGPRSWARHSWSPARPAEADRRLHRVRAAPVRAHGGADLPQGRRAARADLPRGRAHARGRAAGAPPLDHEHPGLLGEARHRRRAGALRAGANDLGGTLMNESISRAAGAAHGQEMPPERMEEAIRAHRPDAEAADDALRHSRPRSARGSPTERRRSPSRSIRTSTTRASKRPETSSARGDVEACRARGMCSDI